MTDIAASPTPAPEIWPTELRLSPDKRTLVVAFDDGGRVALPAEYLRVESPSAEVRGHSPAERKTVPGKRDVTISGIEPVGNYAVRLVFSDGHSTGIYGWGFLAELGARHDEIWAEYLGRLAEAKLSRDPGGTRA
jgi:DUF971 family protein